MNENVQDLPPAQPPHNTGQSQRSGGILGPTTHGAPSCDVCGRRDQTLRAVVIPYVFSLLVVTMRRAWTGVFCWRHRVQRLLAAGLISALTGWWGIPWGFIYTPATLFKLLRGGDIPEDTNVELLARIAVHKLNTGEPGDAMRVFQEALRIKEDERTRNSLHQLQAKYPLSSELKDYRVPQWYVVSLVSASLLGMGLGLFDYLVTTGIGWIIGEEAYLVLAILSWAPFLALMIVGAILLKEGLQWVFERTRTDNLLMGILFAAGFGGLLWYGIPQGYLIGDYFSAIINGLGFDSTGDFIMTSGAVITQGGIWFVLDAIESGLPGDIIYLIIWGLAGVTFLWLAISSAQESVHWQVRLELLQGDLRMQEPRSEWPAWGALAGVGLFFMIGFAIFASRGRILRGGPDLVVYSEQGDAYYLAGDYLQAEQAYRQAIQTAPGQAGPHNSLGWVLYAVGRFEEAADSFARAMELDRSWADPHIGLAYLHLSSGELAAAEVEFQVALDVADEAYSAAQAYHGLGNVAHQRDDLEAAIAYYEQAVREDWQLATAHMDMAIAYFAMGDFARAIAHATDIIGFSPDWGAPHALLALANFQLDQSEALGRELDWAADLSSEDIYSLLLLADVYWGLGEYAEAEMILQRARLLYPENLQVALLLARLAAQDGDFAEADALIDTQIDQDPSAYESYLARAWVAIEKQDLPSAEAALDQSLSLNADNWEAHNLRSFVYFHLGRIDEAYLEADAAIRAYRFESSAYVHRAFAARAQGNIEAAQDDAEQAILLEPKYDLAHFILGVVQFDRGDSVAGAESLRLFLELARDRAYVRDYVLQAQAFMEQVP